MGSERSDTPPRSLARSIAAFLAVVACVALAIFAVNHTFGSRIQLSYWLIAVVGVATIIIQYVYQRHTESRDPAEGGGV